MLLASLICAIAASGVQAVGVRPGQIKNLVTFGDSYTDVVATGASTISSLPTPIWTWH
jgi:phospholipase/lecithinase/hemolysin